MLLDKAETLYFDLLPAFRRTISNEGKTTTVHSLITAVLLGLYEIITTTSTDLGSHTAHARGVSAILTNKFSLFDLVSGVQLSQLPNPLIHKDLDLDDGDIGCLATATVQTADIFSILCMPLINSTWATLDPIFVKTISLKRKAEKLLDDERDTTTPEDLQLLKQEAELVREDYQRCVLNLAKEWTPVLVGHIPGNQNDMRRPEAGYWPGPVLSYYDHYVACIINSYAKSQLLVLNVIARCQGFTQDTEIDPLIWEEAQKLALKMVASIPYFLSENVQVFADQSLASGATSSQAITPGPSVGGLLIMHTLYMVSKLSVLDPMLKIYLKDCLAWIGRNMGIGQATMLAEDTSMNRSDYITQAHVLVWAGMLL